MTVNMKVIIKLTTLANQSLVASESNMDQMAVFHVVVLDQLLLAMSVFAADHTCIPMEFAASAQSTS